MARMRPLAALLAPVLLLAGCGDEDPPRRDPPTHMVKTARLGEAIELSTRRGEPVLVTVRGVQDPVRDHQLEGARISGRFVGIEIALHNRGDIGFRGSPRSGSHLTTTKGAEDPTLELKQGSCLGVGRVVISPDARRRMCIPFRVDDGARLLKFRYSPEGGFSPAAGVWDLN